MDNDKEISSLIESFKQYRDLLSPVEANLKNFADTYQNMKDDIQKLNTAFGGNLQGQLDKIYKDLSSQAEKSKVLMTDINKFASSTSKYVAQVESLIAICSNLESKIKMVDEIQKRAEDQIDRLNEIIEEKKRTYDLKQLEKNLDSYNTNVQKVSEFINKDVADVLKSNSDQIGQIHDKNNSVLESLLDEKQDIASLVESYKSTNELLKKVVEKNDVNMSYIFDIIDKWAEDRKVKTRK